VRLRIEIDSERTMPALGDAREEIESGRGLADAAFLVEDRDDRLAPECTGCRSARSKVR